jgi:hypothetical protein
LSHSISFILTFDRSVIFGGVNGKQEALGDAWQFDFGLYFFFPLPFQSNRIAQPLVDGWRSLTMQRDVLRARVRPSRSRARKSSSPAASGATICRFAQRVCSTPVRFDMNF